MPEIPYMLRLGYGLVETSVFMWFIIVFLNIKLDRARVTIMVLCTLLTIMGLREVTNNLLIHVLAGMAVFNFYLWLFTGRKGISVLLAVLITYITGIILEPLSIVLFPVYASGLDYKLAWLVSGMPHILVIALITLIVMGVRKRVEKNNAATF